jgi:cytochrome c1
MTQGDPVIGKTTIDQVGCSGCHTIPGIRDAHALVGPPLDHFSKRTYIGGVMENTPSNLIAWLLDPPAHAPRTAMPNLKLSEQQARDIAAYLYTLK